MPARAELADARRASPVTTAMSGRKARRGIRSRSWGPARWPVRGRLCREWRAKPILRFLPISTPSAEPNRDPARTPPTATNCLKACNCWAAEEDFYGGAVGCANRIVPAVCAVLLEVYGCAGRGQSPDQRRNPQNHSQSFTTRTRSLCAASYCLPRHSGKAAGDRPFNAEGVQTAHDDSHPRVRPGAAGRPVRMRQVHVRTHALQADGDPVVGLLPRDGQRRRDESSRVGGRVRAASPRLREAAGDRASSRSSTRPTCAPRCRKPFIEMARKYHVQTVAVVFDFSAEFCHERNQKRAVGTARSARTSRGGTRKTCSAR